MGDQVPGQFTALTPRFEHDKKGKNTVLVSNFLITLNTNVRFEEGDKRLEEASGPLVKMAEQVFGNSNGLREIVVFGTRGPRGAGGGFTFIPDSSVKWGIDTIADFRTTAGVEIGHNARGKRLHLHVALKIRHRSYIRLDKNKILKRANEELESLGFPYPIKHVNIRVTPPTAEDYLDK